LTSISIEVCSIMLKIQTIKMPQLSCELEEFLSATDQDLNLAQEVSNWTLKRSEGIYSDGEFAYYSVIMEIPIRGIIDRTMHKPVWIRSTVKMHSGGRWEPDEYDEVLVDAGQVFLSLADAVKQSKLDNYEKELMEINNSCSICDGSGMEDYFAEISCKACLGAGHHFFIKPQKNK